MDHRHSATLGGTRRPMVARPKAVSQRKFVGVSQCLAPVESHPRILVATPRFPAQLLKVPSRARHVLNRSLHPLRCGQTRLQHHDGRRDPSVCRRVRERRRWKRARAKMVDVLANL